MFDYKLVPKKYHSINWKQCSPYYYVSENGDIFSEKRQGTKGGIIKLGKSKQGYPHFSLRTEGKQKTAKVHRLVALAFIPNPENKPEVNHKDGNKLNNNVENLEWVYGYENKQHAWDTGLRNRISSCNERYIYRLTPNCYEVKREINGKVIIFGYRKTLEEAVILRNSSPIFNHPIIKISK